MLTQGWHGHPDPNSKMEGKLSKKKKGWSVKDEKAKDKDKKAEGTGTEEEGTLKENETQVAVETPEVKEGKEDASRQPRKMRQRQSWRRRRDWRGSRSPQVMLSMSKFGQ